MSKVISKCDVSGFCPFDFSLSLSLILSSLRIPLEFRLREVGKTVGVVIVGGVGSGMVNRAGDVSNGAVGVFSTVDIGTMVVAVGFGVGGGRSVGDIQVYVGVFVASIKTLIDDGVVIIIDLGLDRWQVFLRRGLLGTLLDFG